MSTEAAADRSVSDSRTVVARVMMPQDANVAGNVFGGTILKMVDEIAYVAATMHARANVVTASVDRMSFLSPVNVGDLLTPVSYTHLTLPTKRIV